MSVSDLLEVEHLTVALPTRAGYRNAVDDLSLTVRPGEVVGIAGESGSGKTMTALSLFGLLPQGARVTGSARLDGTDLLRLSGRRLRDVRGRQVAMVSQDPSASLHPILTIGTQLTEHMRHHLGVSKSEALTRAAALLDTVRIPDPEQALSSYPGQFSGGMRQRIAIAVALAAEPRLLVADEPTTALDVTVQAGILRLLDRLCQERDMAVIVITHDLGVMSALARRVYTDMHLYDLRVTVDSVAGRPVCGLAPGDYFELTESSRVTLPPGRHFCLYALAAVLPLLPAKQRDLPAGDWLERDSLVACPDPDERLVMRITRTRRRALRSADLT